MTYADKLRDLAAREKFTAKWSIRIKRLKKIKAMTQTAFCEKYGINHSEFSRHKAGKITPEWETVHKVETALTAEGV